MRSTLPSADVDGRSSTEPRLADGVELFGEYESGGFVEPTFLAGRADGQVIQLSRLLYLVARHLDEAADLGQVAERVSADYGRQVSVANVTFLLEQRLAPLGLLAPPPGTVAPAPVATPLFALGLRAAMVPAGVVRLLSRPLLFLFRAPVVVLVLAAMVAVDVWLFAFRGVTSEFISVLTDPALLAVLGVLQWSSLAFHELGHATACRYGGAKPGKIGAGIFLIWPVFYTDVTDSYRLNRRGRLRTDLAGVYFDVVVTLLFAAAYALTGAELLLVAIVFQHVDIAYQFAPFLRLDGYYMVTDLVGVPDLYGRIGPILRSLRPGQAPDPAVTELKPRVRVIVTIWVISSVSVIVAGFGLLVVNTPAWFARATAALGRYAEQVGASWASGDFLDAAFNAWRVVMLFVPAIGTIYLIHRLVSLRRRTKALRRLSARGAAGQASAADLQDYPFKRQFRGYDRKEVKAMLAALAPRLMAPAVVAVASDDELEQARDDARRIVEAAELEAASRREQARQAAEEVAMATVGDARQLYEDARQLYEDARQLYEDAAEEAARIRADAERRSAEILDAARRQLDLAVELKLEPRRELDAEDLGGGLRVVPDRRAEERPLAG